MGDPKIILLFSGKRKSGKDYVCEKLKSIWGESDCTIIRISGPLKELYAKNHNLDLKELLSDSPYKEHYRRAMIEWSDEIRRVEPGYFCKAACDNAECKPIWIVSDIRRKTDIKWFQDTFQDKIKTIRVCADLPIRIKRGWVFTSGVDDVDSECNLDDVTNWDLKISNNDCEELKSGIEAVVLLVTSVLQ